MKKTHLITLFAAAALLGACSESEPELVADMDEGSRTEEATIEYDSRFPFPVWTDESGDMHFEFDEVKPPTSDELFANLVGKGWDISMAYDYTVNQAHAGYPGSTSFNEYDNMYYGWVSNSTTPHYFIDSRESGTIFHEIIPIPGLVPEEELGTRIMEIRSEKISYDETTGELNFHCWSGFRVALSTPSELWIYWNSDIIEDVTIYKIKAVSDADVAAWREYYSK